MKMLALPKSPLVLGIHMGHDASIALCSPSGIHFSIAEERLTRIKHCSGFPIKSVECLFDVHSITAQDIRAIAFSAAVPFFPQHENGLIIDNYGTAKKSSSTESSAVIADHWKPFADRHWSNHETTLARFGLSSVNIPYYYIAHHRAHASGAFRLSGMDSAAILTLDGWGGQVSGLIGRGNLDGSIDILRVSHERDSIGSLYQAVTEALGFIPVDGEYKTMGLAALGSGSGCDKLADFIIVEDGVLRSKMPWTYRDYNSHYPHKKLANPLESICEADYFRSLLNTMTEIELAEAAQNLCELTMVEMARKALSLSGKDRLVAAGGVMLNVKGNHRICKELKISPSDFFIFPDAADSGLAAGAALETLHQLGLLGGSLILDTPFLGPEFTEDEIFSSLLEEESEICFERTSDITTSTIAQELANGRVVGCFQGRMEIGPRALGNRSVFADPRSAKIKDRINLLLKGRDPFVPFAPVILEDDASRFLDPSPSFRYMTFAVPAYEDAKRLVPGVVHVDGSLRPEIVNHEFNPWLYDLLVQFRSLSGYGVLINTSFNRHGLPIVGRPCDAIDHLKRGWIDILAIGPFIARRKNNS